MSSGDGGFTLVCISGCRGVIGFNIAMSQLSVREKVCPARLVVGLRVTKFAQHAKNGRKSAFYGVLGEFCTGLAQECPVQGEFCTGLVGERVCWASVFAYTGTVARYDR